MTDTSVCSLLAAGEITITTTTTATTTQPLSGMGEAFDVPRGSGLVWVYILRYTFILWRKTTKKKED